MPYFFISIFFFAWPLIVSAAPLSPAEIQIRQYITNHQSESLDFLAQLVNINSGTENSKGVEKVGLLLEKQFKKLGFTTTWAKEPKYMHKAATLIARHQGKQGKHLLLIGHLDTVFSPKSSFKRFKKEGAEVSGPGVSDDKGGVVAILYALKALANAKALDHMTITVVLTGDEEESGKPTTISRKPLIDAAKNMDVALDFEPAVSSNQVSIGRRGITSWLIKSQGREGHSSTIFKEDTGDGAIFELARILNTMRRALGQEQNLSVNPGIIVGGTRTQFDNSKANGQAFGKTNVVAKTALAEGDLRYLTLAQKETAKQKIQAIVNQHLPHTHAEVTFVDGIPAMEPTENNSKLLEVYSQLSQDLGYGPVHSFDAGLKGAGDISYVAGMVSMNLVGLGPVGSGQHSLEEKMEIKSLEINTLRAALLIYRLAAQGVMH